MTLDYNHTIIASSSHHKCIFIIHVIFFSGYSFLFPTDCLRNMPSSSALLLYLQNVTLRTSCRLLAMLHNQLFQFLTRYLWHPKRILSPFMRTRLPPLHRFLHWHHHQSYMHLQIHHHGTRQFIQKRTLMFRCSKTIRT